MDLRERCPETATKQEDEAPLRPPQRVGPSPAGPQLPALLGLPLADYAWLARLPR
jgi:hypothetical protein